MLRGSSPAVVPWLAMAKIVSLNLISNFNYRFWQFLEFMLKKKIFSCDIKCYMIVNNIGIAKYN